MAAGRRRRAIVGGMPGVPADVLVKVRHRRLFEHRLNSRVVEHDGQTMYEGVLQDVSDLRRVEDAVRQAEALAYVAKLANAAAHEIKNPLGHHHRPPAGAPAADHR